ncbi:MAG: YncE family protein [Bryobacteraceae bacterium]
MNIPRNHLRLGAAMGFSLLLVAGSTGCGKKVSSVQAQADNWVTPEAQRLGVRLLDTRDSSGSPAYPVADGDLLFFTNVGTSYGAKNPKNSVVVINAKTKKPIAISDLDPTYTQKFASHGIGVSPDGKYTYLPSITSIAGPEGKTPDTTLVLDTRTLKIHQILATGGASHHAKIIRLASGKELMLIEHFNWNTPRSPGKGFFVVDPNDNNKVVAGMSTAELHGNPYSGFSTPDGRFLYYSVPPPNRGDLLRAIDGWLAKIDTSTWAVVQSLPLKKYPIWTVFTKDGKYAWVTQSEEETVAKVQRAQQQGERDKVVAEVRTGPGPYGMRLSYDDKELWVADKGESGPKDGLTITVIDTTDNRVKQTIQTDCVRNDHIILSPEGSEMWATCNTSHDIVVIDAKTKAIKTRIPMPNLGDSHGGVFVQYTQGPNGLKAEVLSDQNGFQGSALDAWLKGAPPVVAQAH